MLDVTKTSLDSTEILGEGNVSVAIICLAIWEKQQKEKYQICTRSYERKR